MPHRKKERDIFCKPVEKVYDPMLPFFTLREEESKSAHALKEFKKLCDRSTSQITKQKRIIARIQHELILDDARKQDAIRQAEKEKQLKEL